MTDDRAIFNLFEECHAEAVESLQEETRMDSPFPPFGSITFPTAWKLLQDMYDGKHWTLMPKMAKWKSRPVKNVPFIVVEGQTTLLTDNRPSISILPRSAEDTDIADLVKAGVDYWWDEQFMDRKLADVVKLSRIFGIGWLHLYWDSEKKEHVCKVVKPWNVLVDPDATCDDYDPTYLIYQFKTTLGELHAKFPDADYERFDPDYRPRDAKMFDEEMYGQTKPRALERAGVATSSRPVWCYQFWLRDGEADFIDKDLEGTGKVLKIRKKKYPNGRLVTVAGGVVLDDRESPYKHGQFPFIPYLAYPVPGKMYGPGDIHNILSLTVYRNRVSQQLYDSIEKSMGALIFVNRRLFKGDRITNEPVQVHEVDDVDRAVRIERMGSLTRHETTLLSVFDKDSDDVAGQHEFSRGDHVPGNKTAEEVSIIAASDQTRMRAAARVVAWANKMLAGQLLSNMAQWTDYEWIVRVAGDDGDSTLPVPFNGDAMRVENEKGKLTDEILKFDIKVDDYSMLPASQRDKSGLYMQLFGMIPGFPIEEFLKGVGLPNYKSIAMKIQEQMDAQMQAQAPDAGMEAPPEEMPQEMGGEIPPELQAMLSAPQGGGNMPPPELMPLLMQLAEQLGMNGGVPEALPDELPLEML
jgi:hypothetical protein